MLPFDRTTLAMAIGRSNAVHLALIDARAAKRVREALSRWETFNGPEAGLNGGDVADDAAVGDETETKEL